MFRSARFRLSCVLTLGFVLLGGCTVKPEAKRDKFLQQGKTKLANKDYSRALIDFRNASQAMPKDAEPHYQMGLAMLQLKNPAGAVYEFQRAVALNPKHVEAQVKLATIMALNNDPEVVREGRKKAESALALSPGNADALHALAVTELRLEAPKDAVKHLEEALGTAPQHLGSAITLAMVKLRAGDKAGAEQLLVKAVADAPRSAEHVFVLGRFYTGVARPADAEKQFRRALELNPAYGPALISLGSLLHGTGRAPQAEEIFKRLSTGPDKQYHHLYALYLFRAGKRDAALAEFERLYQADPSNREHRTRLVAMYFRLGRTADVEKVLNEALARNAKDVYALRQRAELNMALGKYSDAQRDATEALRFYPDSAESRVILARIHQRRGDTATQRQQLNEALRLNPKLLEARIELARAFTTMRNSKAALELLGDAPPDQRQSLPVILERNAALFATGDYAAVRKGVDQGLAIARTPALLYQDAILKLTMKDPRAARVSLEEILAADPQNWSALEALTATYKAQQNVPEATAAVRQYLAKSPPSAAAQNFLGSWLAAAGDKAGARTAFETAKSLSTQSTFADLRLAEMDLAENKADAARVRLLNVLNQDQQNVAAMLLLAQIEQGRGQTGTSMDYYEKVIARDPNNSLALNNLAYLLADTNKDPDRALQLAQKVKQLVPNHPAVDDTIGWAFYKKGMYQSAIDHLKAAAESGSPARKVHLAMAHLKMGQRDQAINLLQGVLKQDPNSADARKALQMLAESR